MNYDGFIDDVSVGDTLLVDGGLQSLAIVAKSDKDVETRVLDGGLMKSRCGAQPKPRAISRVLKVKVSCTTLGGCLK